MSKTYYFHHISLLTNFPFSARLDRRAGKGRYDYQMISKSRKNGLEVLKAALMGLTNHIDLFPQSCRKLRYQVSRCVDNFPVIVGEEISSSQDDSAVCNR